MPIPVFVQFLGNLTGLEASLGKAEAQLTKVSASGAAGFTKMGMLGKAAMLGVAAGVGELAIKSVEAASHFQAAMELLHTQANVSQHSVDQLSQSVLSLAPKMGTGPDELATALYHIESTLDKTLPPAKANAIAMHELQVAAEGARIGQADLESVTNALNAAVASGIPGVQNLEGAMGTLNAVVGAGDMKMDDLAEALGTGVLSAVKGFGLSLNDVGAALATFGDNNIRGADAATQLRMAVEFLAAPTAHGVQQLENLGIAAGQLKNDMAEGGLNQALTDLHDHLEKAGVSSKQLGGILVDTFGKKAGTGLSILLDQYDRFESKTKELGAGAESFGEAWSATTQTVAFKFDAARTSAETLAITLGQHLMPAAGALADGFSKVSGFVTDNIDTIGRLVEVLAGAAGLYGAWELASTAVSLSVGAFRMVSSAVGNASAAVSLFAEEGIASISAWSAGTDAALGSVAVAEAAATAGITLLIGGLAAWAVHSEMSKRGNDSLGQSTQALTGEVQQLTDAVKQDSGALADNVQQVVRHALQTTGAYDAANKLGISLGDLTLAAMGNTPAIARVNAEIDAYTNGGNKAASAGEELVKAFGGTQKQAQSMVPEITKVRDAIGNQNTALGQAVHAYQQEATAQQQTKTATDGVASSVQRTVPHVVSLAESIDRAKNSTTAFSNALDVLLGGTLSVQQATDAFQKSVNDLGTQLDKKTKSLRGDTDAAIANRGAIDDLIQKAMDHASALQKQGASAEASAAALKKDTAAIEKSAEAHGIAKKDIDAYLTSVGAMPAQIDRAFGLSADEAQKHAQTMHDQVLAKLRDLNVLSERTGEQIPAGLAQGINANTGLAISAAQALAAKVHITVAQALRVQSPSRVMMEIGKNVVDGLVLGLTGNSSKVATAADSLVKKLLAAKATLGNVSGYVFGQSFVDVVQGQLSQVEKLSKQNDSVVQQLQTAQANLADLQKQADSYGQSILSNLANYSDVTGVKGQTDANGNTLPVAGTDIVSYLKQQLTGLTQFAGDISQLRSGGLNQTTLQQLISAGPTSLDSATALVAGGSSIIAQVNALQNQISATGAQYAQSQESAQYGTLISTAQKQVAEIQSQSSKLQAQMKVDADRMVAEIEKHLAEVARGNVKLAEATSHLKSISASSSATSTKLDALPAKLASAVTTSLRKAGVVK